MIYRTKYSEEIVDKVRNGATAQELGLTKREYEHVKRYRVDGKKRLKKRYVADGRTGRRSWHSHPIGHERFDKDGYILVKVAYPRVERRKQFIEWEKHNPPTDNKTECLIFLDGDKTNCNIDNLMKIKRKYMGCINHYAPVGMPPDLRRAAIMSAILYSDAKEKEKSKERKLIKKQQKLEKTKEKHQRLMALYMAGLKNKDIADLLEYKKYTVNTFVCNYHKQGLLGYKYGKTNKI